MKSNIFLILSISIVTICTFCFISCNTLEEDKNITTKLETKICETTSTEKSITNIAEDDKNNLKEQVKTDNNNFDCYKSVDDILFKLCKSEKFINSTEDEKAQLGLSTLKKLEEEGLILQGSIIYNKTNGNIINFKYINGTQGTFILKDFNPKIN